MTRRSAAVLTITTACGGLEAARRRGWERSRSRHGLKGPVRYRVRSPALRAHSTFAEGAIVDLAHAGRVRAPPDPRADHGRARRGPRPAGSRERPAVRGSSWMHLRVGVCGGGRLASQPSCFLAHMRQVLVRSIDHGDDRVDTAGQGRGPGLADGTDMIYRIPDDAAARRRRPPALPHRRRAPRPDPGPHRPRRPGAGARDPQEALREGTSRPPLVAMSAQLNLLLDLNSMSVTLHTLQRAAEAVGRRVRLELV